jgi:hypothetical protein
LYASGGNVRSVKKIRTGGEVRIGREASLLLRTLRRVFNDRGKK